MKYLLIILSLFLSINSFAQDTDAWLVNMDDAKKEARKEDKFILLSFSGSDWCGNCMRLENELFQSVEFNEFAEENLVLLNLDFPAKKANKLSPEQTEHNEKYAELYNKAGLFPLTLILNPDGSLQDKMSYPNNSIEAYINNLSSIVLKE